MKALAIAAAFSASLVAGLAAAQDHSMVYSRAEIEADADRLETAARKIYSIGVEPFLTAEEKAALKDLRFSFPIPAKDDFILDFYAYHQGGEAIVALPIMSLKAVEDLTTAYAWLHSNGYAPGTIDLYFAMMRRPDPTSFPGGRYPAILPALGVPADAYKYPPVDDLSLRLRNEAIAFALIHELGHIVHAHKDYFEISTAQARADEIQADQFAFDVLSRTDTPTLGGALFFTALAYSLPHRGQFETEKAWLGFLHERATHPPTTDRIRGIAAYTAGPLADRRPAEREIWSFIGAQLGDVADILDDEELQTCIERASRIAPMAALKPRREPAVELFREACL